MLISVLGLDTWDDFAVLEGNSTPTLVLTVLFSLALFKGPLGLSIPLKVLLTPRNKFDNQRVVHAYERSISESRSTIQAAFHLPLPLYRLALASRHKARSSVCGIRSGRLTTGVFCFARRKRLHCRFLGTSSNYNPVVTYFSEKCTEARGIEDKFRPTAVR